MARSLHPVPCWKPLEPFRSRARPTPWGLKQRSDHYPKSLLTPHVCARGLRKGGRIMKLANGVAFMFANALILIAGSSQAFDQGSTTSHEAATPFQIAQAEQEKEPPPSGEIQERAVPGLPGTRPGIVFPGMPPTVPGAVTLNAGSVTGGTPVQATVTLNAPVSQVGLVGVPAVLALQSSNPAVASVPPSVAIPQAASRRRLSFRPSPLRRPRILPT